MNAFVHIVESPSSADLLEGATEGRSLGEALALAQIRYCYNLVTDAETLGQALAGRLEAAWRHYQHPPIVHLSMHGSPAGVVLTDHTRLSWDDLRTRLAPLNAVMQGGLLVCMSSCFGGSGGRMAMADDEAPTFWALVGNTGAIGLADTTIAYISFYHLLFKGFPLATCADSMRVASGNHGFVFEYGQQAKASWLSFIASRGIVGAATEQVVQELEGQTSR
jgi:hypothetical protein